MQSLKVNSMLVLTILLWASAFVGIRIALVDYHPGPLALLRFIVASICLSLIYMSQEIKTTIPWRDRFWLMGSGVLGIGIYNVCLNYGEVTVPAGIASFIIGLMPVFTAILCLMFLKEQLTKGAWLGIFISFLGLFLLAEGESMHIETRLGIFLILISAMSGSVLTLLQKKFLKDYHPVALTSWIIWGGTFSMCFYLPQLAQDFKTAQLSSTLAVIYLGIFPAAIAYLAWTYVLKYMSASKASVSLYALPFVSTILGFVLLHEQPSLTSLTGGGVALIGAFIANHFQSQEPVLEALDELEAA